MRFYEFEEFGYYALIGAKSQEKAKNYYEDIVSDITENDGEPTEITKEEARKKLELSYKCYKDELDPEDKWLEEFDDRVEDFSNNEEPYLVLVDGSLF